MAAVELKQSNSSTIDRRQATCVIAIVQEAGGLGKPGKARPERTEHYADFPRTGLEGAKT